MSFPVTRFAPRPALNEFQHNQLSDRGPDNVKAAIQAKVQAFLDEDEGVSPIPFLSAAAPDRVAATAPAKK